MDDGAGGTYQFDYDEHGVYGHVMRLVREHARDDGVLVDLGCGFGAIAEQVRDQGLTYLGLDYDPEGPESLRMRGFESGTIDLLDVPAAVEVVQRALDGRPLAAVTLLDTLEHVTSGGVLLAALGDLAAASGAPLVVSVPNVSHRDIAIKLLTGRFDYTSTGLLDQTHLVLYTERLLAVHMRGAGWREVGSADFALERSDQFFPPDHVGLVTGSALHQLLYLLRDQAGPHAATNQFVRAYLPGARRPSQIVLDEQRTQAVDEPLLSVVLRTQGDRPELLRDALMCLQGQTNQDFEVVVAAHDADERGADIEAAVAQLPGSLRRRVQIVRVEGGKRGRPLNVAVEHARGRYVAVLDDDDLVFGHWVETFAGLASRSPGALLRTVCVVQSISPRAWVDGRRGFTPLNAPQAVYPSRFDLFAHLMQNFTPFMAWAFPRSLHRDFGVRFDETLDICEDWDYELRCALLLGVTDTDTVTCMYRRWDTGSSSETLHAAEEWRRAEAVIVAKLDAQGHLFPAGTVRRIRDGSAFPFGIAMDIEALRRENGLLRTEIGRLEGVSAELDAAFVRLEASRSWRVTRPLRAATSTVGRLRHRG